MDRVNISQVMKYVNDVCRTDLTKQETYYVIEILLKIRKINEYQYNFDDIFFAYDTGRLDNAVRRVMTNREKKTNNKEAPYPEHQSLPKQKSQMELASDELLKNDEVWYEINKRIGEIIREELIRIC